MLNIMSYNNNAISNLIDPNVKINHVNAQINMNIFIHF